MEDDDLKKIRAASNLTQGDDLKKIRAASNLTQGKSFEKKIREDDLL